MSIIKRSQGVVIALSLAVIAAIALSMAIPAAARGSTHDGLTRLRATTARYNSLGAAQDAGYTLLKDAAGIACIDLPGTGAMGVHYANGALVGDGIIDAARPEAMVYAPMSTGDLRLAAVEYVVFQADWDAAHATPPSLFGQEFMLTAAGNRFGLPAYYSLHVWVWQDNPSGMFSMWNPSVSCDGAASVQYK